LNFNSTNDVGSFSLSNPLHKHDTDNSFAIFVLIITYGTNTYSKNLIGVDKLIFQDLTALTESVQLENPAIRGFDCSVFTGEYITGDITPEYLDKIASQRNDSAKKKREKDASNLEIHNEG